MKRLARRASRAAQVCGRLLVVGGIFAAGSLYLSFGTLTPCGILREAIRQRGNFAAILPEDLINFALESQYGPMSDNRCFGILLQQIIQVEPPYLRLESALPHVIERNLSLGSRAAGVEHPVANAAGDHLPRRSNSH
jgi:hypothetical protein